MLCSPLFIESEKKTIFFFLHREEKEEQMKIKQFRADDVPSVNDALEDCLQDYTKALIPCKFKQLWQTYVVMFTVWCGEVLETPDNNFLQLLDEKILSMQGPESYEKFENEHLTRKTVDQCIDYLKFHLLACYCTRVYLTSPRTDYPNWYENFVESRRLSDRVVRKLNTFQWSLYSNRDKTIRQDIFALRPITEPLLTSNPNFMFFPVYEQTSFIPTSSGESCTVYSTNNSQQPLWTVKPRIPDDASTIKSMTNHIVIAERDFLRNEVLAVLDPSTYVKQENEVVTNNSYLYLPMLMRRWRFFTDSTRTECAYVNVEHRADVVADLKAGDDPSCHSSLLALADESHFFGHKNMPIRPYNAKVSSGGVIYVTAPNGIKKGEEIIIHRRTQIAWNCTEDAMQKYIYRFCDNNNTSQNFFFRNAVIQRKECRADVNFIQSNVSNVSSKPVFASPIAITLNQEWICDMFLRNIDRMANVVPSELRDIIRAPYIFFIRFLHDNLKDFVESRIEWNNVRITYPSDEKDIMKATDGKNKNMLYYACTQYALQQHQVSGNVTLRPVHEAAAYHVLPLMNKKRRVYLYATNDILAGEQQSNPVSYCTWDEYPLPNLFIMEGFDVLPILIKERMPTFADKAGTDNHLDEYEQGKHKSSLTPMAAVCEEKNLRMSSTDGSYFDFPFLCEAILRDGKMIVVRRSSYYRKINNYILYQLSL